MLYIKSLLLAIFLPGTVVVYIPYLIVAWGRPFVFPEWGVLQIVGVILAGLLTLAVADPSFQVREGMTYQEVKAILGPTGDCRTDPTRAADGYL